MATIHPRLHARGTPKFPGAVIRVLACVPTERIEWVERELACQGVTLQIGYSVAQVVDALVEDPPPRPQILIVDLDALSPGELMHLHSVREYGWFGKIVALGVVPGTLVKSLSVDHVIAPPFIDGTLAVVLDDSDYIAATTRMPVING